MTLKTTHIPSSMEKDYQSYLTPEKIRSTRVMSVLALLLYSAFIVIDIYALPSVVYEAFVIRLFVIASLGFAIVFSFTSKFSKYYHLVQATPYFLAGVSINLMILISSPTDEASDIYFAGLILVIMAIFSWAYLNLLSVSLSAFTIIGLYVYVEFYKHAGEPNSFLPTVLSNCFFLVCASVIGFVTQYVRDQYLKENFLLQQSLKLAYEQKSAEAHDNQYLANHDALTELPNRRYMMKLLNESLDKARIQEKILVILFIDLNGFKQINDVYGHNAGDETLTIIAKRLELAIRRGDHLSRLGGDEYLMGLILDKKDITKVEGIANKYAKIIGQPMNIEGKALKVGASIGVAIYPKHGDNIEDLINIADQKMYEVKKVKPPSTAVSSL
ncbi:GGDEF domain-containing protein [Leucothrix mucor]|uniref:GGDEF domain-containing protein n=1 Tax=Leucothrix mucor TaxID=45248 RepID=UPI000A04BC11|nr:GGDEF domain-containing protein [Leucothrix mucor]